MRPPPRAARAESAGAKARIPAAAVRAMKFRTRSRDIWGVAGERCCLDGAKVGVSAGRAERVGLWAWRVGRGACERKAWTGILGERGAWYWERLEETATGS